MVQISPLRVLPASQRRAVGMLVLRGEVEGLVFQMEVPQGLQEFSSCFLRQ